MRTKVRNQVPGEIAAKVLFASDRTCVVCRDRGKPVQIHHMDDDPGNHEEHNLAVLCFDCHHETQVRGGFHRRLDVNQVAVYRDDWLNRVATRRKRADELASANLPRRTTKISRSVTRKAALPRQTQPKWPQSPEALLPYVRDLPRIRREAFTAALDGKRHPLDQESYLIAVLEKLLVHLASWYPERHFGDQDPKDYFNSVTASRFEWHRAYMEFEGRGTGGAFVAAVAGGFVVRELEDMVADLVQFLMAGKRSKEAFNFLAWKVEWEAPNKDLQPSAAVEL